MRANASTHVIALTWCEKFCFTVDLHAAHWKISRQAWWSQKQHQNNTTTFKKTHIIWRIIYIYEVCICKKNNTIYIMDIKTGCIWVIKGKKMYKMRYAYGIWLCFKRKFVCQSKRLRESDSNEKWKLLHFELVSIAGSHHYLQST